MDLMFALEVQLAIISMPICTALNVSPFWSYLNWHTKRNSQPIFAKVTAGIPVFLEESVQTYGFNPVDAQSPEAHWLSFGELVIY